MIRKVCFFGTEKKAFYANWIGFTNLKSVWTGKKSIFCNPVLPYPIPSYQIPSLPHPTRILNTILHLYKILLPYTTLSYHIEIEPNQPTAETSRIGTPSKFTQAEKSRPKRPKLWAYLLFQNRFRFPKLSVPMVSTVSHKPKLVSLISQNGQFQFSAILTIFWKLKIKWFYDIIVRFSFVGGPKWVTVNTLNYPHSNTIKTTTK